MRVAEHSLRAADGWRLSLLDLIPDGPARGLVIAGHAMMVDRRTLYRHGRPSLAAALADAGLRVLVPDLRGHGTSGPAADRGADWSYDQLVEDTACYLEFARALAPDLRVATLGHSLFGHTTLAWLSRRPADPPALHVALCCEIWLRGTESRPLAWPIKQALVRATAATARLLGAVPTRRVGFGSADEALTYFADFARFARTGWRAADGHDYQAGLADVTTPVLLVQSDGDRIAPPRTALSLWSALPNAETWRLGAPPWQSLRPGHMATVTDPANAPLWTAIAAWLKDQLSP
jgi:predicted alpha/beta hydrolase